MTAKVIFIGAGPGDPDLITVKGRKIIEKADVIIYAGSLVKLKTSLLHVSIQAILQFMEP